MSRGETLWMVIRTAVAIVTTFALASLALKYLHKAAVHNYTTSATSTTTPQAIVLPKAQNSRQPLYHVQGDEKVHVHHIDVNRRRMLAFAAMGSSIGATSAPVLYSYLKGSWNLSKRLEYSKGGGFGDWVGQSRFDEYLDSHNGFTLKYSEEGSMHFDGTQNSFQMAGRQLVWDFGCRPPKVYFLEGDALRFFHDLPLAPNFSATRRETVVLERSPEPLCSFNHLCVEDMYRGKLYIHDENHFEISWRVEGPTKDGSALLKYERVVVT